ncbi:hypothetical protein FGIG_04007 [Fasciola gigantica]|uniref:Tubulin polyglutamylase TTLL4 n=1 Tax=Fasciola gigantica TaxID=46835 RepID=A0A504Z4P4_FASGI|nr:hypothetical protein FGIG_04007 [Fasciola gigantica]
MLAVQPSRKIGSWSTSRISNTSAHSAKSKASTVLPKITPSGKTNKRSGAIELRKLHHLISEQPKRKISAHKCEVKQNKPMHTHAVQNRPRVIQKHFAKELTARLAKLALTSCVNELYDSCKNLDFGISIPFNGDQEESKKNEMSEKTPKDESAPSNKSLQSESSKLGETKCTQYPEAVRDAEKVATEEQCTQCDSASVDLEKNKGTRKQPISNTTDGGNPLTSKICGDDESEYEPNKEFHESTGAIYGNELDCIDDDKVQLEDSESGADASDSDVSHYDLLQGTGGELLPVIASLFPNTPSVVRFVGDGQTVSKFPRRFRSLLRWRPSLITPNVVKRALRRSHFRLSTKSADWLGYYGNHLKPMAFRPIREFQKVNHFPGSFQLGRKDKLWSNICRLRSQFGRKVVDFVPRTFYLPCDMRVLKECWARNDPLGYNCSTNIIGSANRPRWILKPPAAARGVGVKLLRQWSDVPKQRNVIIQSYISRPYLINETKFDLRLYVYVTGFNPFRAYLHRQGLVRFASQKYTNSTAEVGNRFVHLTNYSVNKHNKKRETGVENHKWKLETLWSYLRDRYVNVEGLWVQIKDIIFKTLASVTHSISIMVEQNCRRRTCVHELFGFDILLDADLKPWLLEVNVSPSLHTNTALDNDVKSALVTDMFNIAGFRLPPEYRSNGQKSSNSQEETPTATNSPSEIVCHSSMSADPTLTSSNSNSHSCTPTQPSNVVSSTERTSHIPVLKPNGELTTAARKRITKSSVVTSSRGSTLTSKTTLTGKAALSSFIPRSDPRLWDMALTWDERQKHLYHSRLFCREESPLHLGFASLKQVAANPRTFTGRTWRTNRTNRRGLNHLHVKPVLTIMDELRGIVAHLTPDDVRTLVDFVDERYRASMGNFECIFPVGGDPGLQMLIFLEACAKDSTTGNLGMRTPTVRYYDLVQYAFLTVYKRSDSDLSSVWHKNPTDVSTLSQLPDYHMLQRGELMGEALIKASKMTGIDREGLARLTELCKRGFHLSGTEAANQRVRWDQNMTFPSKNGVFLGSSKTKLPIELGSRRIRHSAHGAKGDVRTDRGRDLVESILGGAVTFHAQTPGTYCLPVKVPQHAKSHGDSGVGTSLISSSYTTPGRQHTVMSKQSDSTQPGTGEFGAMSHSSNVTSPRSRTRSMGPEKTNSYAGRSLGETMGWWGRSKSLISVQNLPCHSAEILASCQSQHRIDPLAVSATRGTISDGTYLSHRDKYPDLSTLLDAQSLTELTQSIIKKKRQSEQTNRSLRTLHPGFSSLASKKNLNKTEKQQKSSHLSSLDPSDQVRQYWSREAKQKGNAMDFAKNEPKSQLNPVNRQCSYPDRDPIMNGGSSGRRLRRESSAHVSKPKQTIPPGNLSKRPTDWM